MPKLQIYTASNYPFPNGNVFVPGLNPGTFGVRKNLTRCLSIKKIFFFFFLSLLFAPINVESIPSTFKLSEFVIRNSKKALVNIPNLNIATEPAKQTGKHILETAMQPVKTMVETGTQTAKTMVETGMQTATKTVTKTWFETGLTKVSEFVGKHSISTMFGIYKGHNVYQDTKSLPKAIFAGGTKIYGGVLAGEAYLGCTTMSIPYTGPYSHGVGIVCGTAVIVATDTIIDAIVYPTDVFKTKVDMNPESGQKTDSETSSDGKPDVSSSYSTESTDEANVNVDVDVESKKKKKKKDCYERVFDAHPNDHRFQRAHGEYIRLKTSEQSVAHGMLRYIIHEYPRSENSLMPSSNSNIVFNELRHCMGFPFRSNTALFQFLQADEGNALFGSRNDLRRDQQIRASAIVDHMIAPGSEQRNLRTLDGAGRFVYSFLKELSIRNMNLDKWTIELFDIDPQVHFWHTLFMPASNTNRLQDILVHPEDEGFHRGTLVYFNFCGLADLVTNVRQTLGSFYENDHETFISWSVRGVNGERLTNAYEFAQWISEERGRGISISRRGTFYTYKLRKRSVCRRERVQKTERRIEQDEKFKERHNLHQRERSKRKRSGGKKAKNALKKIKKERERRRK